MQKIFFGGGEVSSFYFFFIVHELRPADIKVIGALGDSLTVSIDRCMASFKLGGKRHF